MASNSIDLTNEQPFRISEWIGIGKMYPKDPPRHVIEARAQLLSIPTSFQRHLPPPSASINKFVKWVMPSTKSSLINIVPSLWFSRDPPLTTPECILTCSVPSDKFVEALGSALGQAWFDGAKSVVDPRYNNGNDRLPLWVIGFWKQTAMNLKMKEEWEKSMQWLSDVETELKPESELYKIIEMVRDRLSQVGWDTNLPYIRRNVHARSLRFLLGRGWLDDDLINAMMEQLTQELLVPESPKDVLIASLGFSDEITRNAESKIYEPKAGAALLNRYESRIKEGGYHRLYFPANVGSHWVGCCIDFVAGTVSYGDSFRVNCPVTKKIMENTQTWLKVRLQLNVCNAGNMLAHGKQDDTINCGIIAVNTIEAGVFKRKLWTPGSATEQRLKWFVKLTSYVCESASNVDDMVVGFSKIDSTLHNDPYWSVLLATGDHNFGQSELIGLILAKTPEEPQSKPQTAAEISDALLVQSVSPDNTNSPNSCAQLAKRPQIQLLAHQAKVLPKKQKNITTRTTTALKTSIQHKSVTAGGSTSNTLGFMTNWLGKGQKGAATVSSMPVKDGGNLSTTLRRKISCGTILDGFDSEDSDEEVRNEDVSMEEEKEGKVEKSAPSSSKLKRKRTDHPKSKDSQQKDFPPSEANLVKYERWQAKILKTDSNALFSNQTIREVLHSKCNKVVTVKCAYDATRWKDHVNTKCPAKAGGERWTTLTIPAHFTKARMVPESAHSHIRLTANEPRSHTGPCPGLTSAVDDRIPNYLYRTAAVGGGGVDPRTLNESDTEFKDLSKEKKDEIRLQQQHTHRWRNDNQALRVFSVNCLTQVSTANGSPCAECKAVLKLPEFQKAIRTQIPADENLKYVNKVNRDPVRGEIFAGVVGLKALVATPNAKDTPCVRYAKGVLSGEYKGENGDAVFSGMMKAIVDERDRKARGKGKQNFHFSPEYAHFAHTLKLSSPQGYRLFREHLPAPDPRTFRDHESRQPRFPQEVCKKTFELAKDHLTKLGYSGECALSCDDTKLLPSLRLYYDSERKFHCLVGATKGPVDVVDPDNVHKALAELKDMKATKLRLYCLTPAILAVTPVVVAALPISNNMTVDKLYPITLAVLEGLISHDTGVISYSADGTETERQVQRHLIDKATERIRITIPAPQKGGGSVEIVIPIILGRPVVMIQDSKHGLKTTRNNLYSGSRCLVLGNFVANFDQVAELANEPLTPLYPRDVHKVDKQDDNAATRLHCADTLALALQKPEKYAGLIVYLFVFGELIDAYQNRSITHSERVVMVLCAHHFLHGWMTGLEVTGHIKRKHAPSREALDIFKSLIAGFLGLIHIYRDHLGSATPLLPWLHSTEACEHLFGEARQLVKEFTMVDFLYMIPKLRIMLWRAMLQQRSQDPRAQAAGYNHTLFDLTGLNERNLREFPTESDISGPLNQRAFDEADSLLDFIGYSPVRLRSIMVTGRVPVELTEVEEDNGSDISEDEDEMGEMEELLRIIEGEEDPSQVLYTKKQEDRITNLTCATLALMVDENEKLHEACSDEDIEELTLTEYSELQAALNRISMVVRDCPSTSIGQLLTSRRLLEVDPTGVMLDLAPLVEMRRHHQTYQAEKCVRTSHHNNVPSNKEEQVSKRELIKQFHEILKEFNLNSEHTAGQDRSARWKNGGGYGAMGTTGNSANAVAIAAHKATKAATKRTKIFKTLKVPEIEWLGNGGITALRALCRNDYLFVMLNEQIYVARVIALFSRTAGKGAYNSSISSSTGITKMSYISIQVFEFDRRHRSFNSRTQQTTALGTFHFDHIPPHAILMTISKPKSASSLEIILQEYDYKCFVILTTHIETLKKALKELRKREPKATVETSDK